MRKLCIATAVVSFALVGAAPAGSQAAGQGGAGSTFADQPAGVFDYQKKVEEAVRYVKEDKLDMADQTLKEVEARRASIPKSFQPEIDNTRKMIDTAKAAKKSGIPIPKL